MDGVLIANYLIESREKLKKGKLAIKVDLEKKNEELLG